MKNLQIMLGNDTIDGLIKKLNELKRDNNKIIRLQGGENQPGLIILHKNIDVEKLKTKAKKK